MKNPTSGVCDQMWGSKINFRLSLTTRVYFFKLNGCIILRHDPDKIMVGEIRDNETAQIAIQSALTGHLVFTTVHANNVVDALGHFLNMGIEPYNFVSALDCVLAQRLLWTATS